MARQPAQKTEQAMDIRGGSAIVTGGASGLGEATVRRLAAAGGKIVIVDRDAARGAALAAELGESCRFAQADVSSAEQISAALDTAQKIAPLRAAVSCAGVGWAQRTLSKEGVAHDLDVFSKVLAVNLVGTFNVLRLAAAVMAKNEPQKGERGVVVNTASIAAFDGQIGQIAYA